MNQEAQGLETQWEDLAVKIRHQLTIFPGISRNMLQAGLGPQIRPRFWKPVLEDMISKGLIKEEPVSTETPTGRRQKYGKLFLAA